jgi:hypothetical protein
MPLPLMAADSTDRIRTPLDYARRVLGRLPSQGVRDDIWAAMMDEQRASR